MMSRSVELVFSRRSFHALDVEWLHCDMRGSRTRSISKHAESLHDMLAVGCVTLFLCDGMRVLLLNQFDRCQRRVQDTWNNLAILAPAIFFPLQKNQKHKMISRHFHLPSILLTQRSPRDTRMNLPFEHINLHLLPKNKQSRFGPLSILSWVGSDVSELLCRVVQALN